MLRALDLCCCAGGATKGLQQVGYHVTGVDTRPQPHYCGDAFIQADAMDLDWSGYDLIWASPPCQLYSVMTPKEVRQQHPNLLPKMAARLRAQQTPYIIENVVGAQHLMRNPIMLCGSMFGLSFRRHRWFELGNVDVFFLLPPCNHSQPPVLITGRGMRFENGKRASHVKIATKRAAMQIDWMTDDEITEAIPPAYSKFLAEQVQQAIQYRSAA
jgi:DNA (cytosine-5)-methyltransferase 1